MVTVGGDVVVVVRVVVVRAVRVVPTRVSRTKENGDPLLSADGQRVVKHEVRSEKSDKLTNRT